MITDRERLLLAAIEKLKDAISILIQGIDSNEVQNALDKGIPITLEANGLVKAFQELHSSDREMERPNKEITISKDNFKFAPDDKA